MNTFVITRIHFLQPNDVILAEFSENSSDETQSCENKLDPISPKVPIQNSTDKTSRTRKKKKNKFRISYPPEIEANKKLVKFWLRRFSLFHRFDEGIRLDEGKYCHMLVYNFLVRCPKPNFHIFVSSA